MTYPQLRILLSLAILCCYTCLLNAKASVLTPSAPEVAANGYLVMDTSSGKVLAEHNANTRAEPASLTKIMTAYVIFSALKNGQIALDDIVPVSQKAWKMKGSKNVH